MAEIVTTLEQRADGLVARVAVDNQAKLNVLDSALSAALEAALRGLAGQAGLRAVVLSGAGTRAMIGGADIREMAGLNPVTARAFTSRIRCRRSGRPKSMDFKVRKSSLPPPSTM